MKHFIHLNDFSKQEIFQIFELADKLKADNGECDWLKGKAIVSFFPESSIRTMPLRAREIISVNSTL